MSESDDVHKLKAHVEQLEYRLAEYHQHFRETAEQRDILALDAAWGVANALAGAVAFSIVFVVAKEVFALEGWILGLVAGLIGSIVQGWVMIRSDRGRFKDRKKLQDFPEWRSEANKLWD